MDQQSPNPIEQTSSGHAVTLVRARVRLSRIASRLRRVLVFRALLVCVSALTLGAMLIGVLDYLLRLPGSVRMVLLLVLCATLARLIWQRVRPAVRTRMSPTDIALQIERQDPSVRGVLASAIDLGADTPGSDDADAQLTDELRLAALRTAARRIEGFNPSGVLRLGVLTRPGGVVSALFLLIVTLGLLSPITLRVAAHRVFTPWDQTRWPVRYAIADITPPAPRAIDAPVPVRALIGSSETALSDTTRAMISWRLLDEQGDMIGDWTRSLLMPQNRRDPSMGIPLYEQLIDARDRAARLPEQQRFTLEYRITTRDDQTRVRRLTLARPPELRSTRVDLRLPDYAQPIADQGVVLSGQLEQQQNDILITPVLAGTRVELLWQFSKAIDQSIERPEWIEQIAMTSQVLAFDHPDERSVRVVLGATESLLIEPDISDVSGIGVRSPITVSLEVLEDLSPSVNIVEPSRDEQLSPRAVIGIKAELSDDLGLTRSRLLAQRSTPPSDSAGAPPEPVGDPVAMVDRSVDIQSRTVIDHELDLTAMGVSPGDELRVWAQGWDLRADVGDEQIGRGESSVRVFRIVDEGELIEQIRRQLDPLRGSLRQLDERQGQVQELLRQASPRAGDEQRSLSERLRVSENAIEQLGRTLDRNNLEDAGLESTLQDAARVLDEAATLSERAEDQIRRGSEETAAQSQRRVRDRLGELLSMLDQGQDSWLALRNIQQLRNELESIRDDTQSLSQRTAGQSLEELSPEDRSMLERILDRQLQNAEDARQAINTLDQRAQELQENDPTQAEALRRAAQQARAAQLEEQLREAGAQISQNQTGSATQTQEEVLEELEELLEELENTIQNRDNALRRELASIIESIKSLIDAQEREIIRLEAAMLDNDLASLDTQLIALVRNTLSVRDEALGAFPETRSIADHISRAASGQNSAISSLRAQPPLPDQAERSQRGALQHLRNALEEAQRLDEQAAQRQAQRAREELREQYQAALDTQSRIHDETAALGDANLSRRDRSQARAIGEQQSELRIELEQMPQQTEGLSEAPVFTLAHTQLDRLMQLSTAGLGQQQIEPATLASQRQSMMILASLVEVLSEQQAEQEDFEDGSSDAGGESGGGQSGGDEPLIPPVAELKLLRSLQQLVADQTRAISEQGTSDASQVRAIGELQQQLFEQGAELIERMNPQPRPQPGDTTPEGMDPDGATPNRDPIEPVDSSGADDS